MFLRRFVHNFWCCFHPCFSQKALQLKGYFEVDAVIFAAFLRQNFSRQTYGRVSSFEVAPLPSFASSDAVNRLRLDERGDKLCLSMLPPRLVARLDTTSSSRRSATPPENAYLKNFGVSAFRVAEHIGDFTSQTIPTRSKFRSGRRAVTIASLSIAPRAKSRLKQDRQVSARAQACATKTGARTRQKDSILYI